MQYVGAALAALVFALAGSAPPPRSGVVYGIGVVQLVNPQVGVVAVDLSAPKSGVVPRAGLAVMTSTGGEMSEIGPKLPAGSAIDDLWFLDREHGWLSVWNLNRRDVRVYRTADGGRHWASTLVTSHTLAAGTVATIRFLDRRHGWLVNQEPTAPDAMLFATSDGGVHWLRVDSQLPEIAPVVFASTRLAWQGGGPFANSLERSRDGGRTWAKMSLPVPAAERGARKVPGLPTTFKTEILEAVSYVRPRRVSLAVYRSRDQGDHWTLTSVHDLGEGSTAAGRYPSCNWPAPLAVSFASPSSWWVGYARGNRWLIDRTADAGNRWHENIVAEGQSRYCGTAYLRALSDNTAWLTTPPDTGPALYATSTGGRRWSRLQPTDPQR